MGHTQQKIGCGIAPGNGNVFLRQQRQIKRLFCNEQGTAIVAQSRATVEQGIAFQQIGIGVVAQFGDIQGPLKGFLVEPFHIAQHSLKLQPFGVNFTVQQGIKNKGIIGTGGKPQTNGGHDYSRLAAGNFKSRLARGGTLANSFWSLWVGVKGCPSCRETARVWPLKMCWVAPRSTQVTSSFNQ